MAGKTLELSSWSQRLSINFLPHNWPLLLLCSENCSQARRDLLSKYWGFCRLFYVICFLLPQTESYQKFFSHGVLFVSCAVPQRLRRTRSPPRSCSAPSRTLSRRACPAPRTLASAPAHFRCPATDDSRPSGKPESDPQAVMQFSTPTPAGRRRGTTLS